MVHLDTFEDDDGSLSVAEECQVRFPIRRVFWIYDVPDPRLFRGDHAHRTCHQLLLALNGKVKAHLIWGTPECTQREQWFELEDPWTGLHVYPWTWLRLTGFQPDTVLMVLSSEPYETDDEILDRGWWSRAVTNNYGAGWPHGRKPE